MASPQDKKLPFPGAVIAVVLVAGGALLVGGAWALNRGSSDKSLSSALPQAPGATYSASASPAYSPVARPAARGDVDGDGKPDIVLVGPGQRAQGGGQLSSVVDVRGTRAGLLRLQLPDSKDTTESLTPVDVDGNGFAEIPVLVKTRGNAIGRVELVALTGNRLALVRVDGGSPLLMPVGSKGGVTYSWGCVSPDGQAGKPGVVEAVAAGDGKIVRTTYRLAGAVAHAQTSTQQASASQVAAAALHECGG